MTDENRRRNLRDEIDRAQQALKAAEALLGLALFSDSISRSYYGAHHMLRALLLSKGVEPKTHAGSIHLFNTELVRTGAFDSAHNRLLGGLQRARELADYDAAVLFSEDDARALLNDARTFADAAIAYLVREGWTPA